MEPNGFALVDTDPPSTFKSLVFISAFLSLSTLLLLSKIIHGK